MLLLRGVRARQVRGQKGNELCVADEGLRVAAVVLAVVRLRVRAGLAVHVREDAERAQGDGVRSELPQRTHGGRVGAT